MSAGRRIIESLKEAIRGDIARVTIDGQVWVRQASSPTDRQIAEAICCPNGCECPAGCDGPEDGYVSNGVRRDMQAAIIAIRRLWEHGVS